MANEYLIKNSTLKNIADAIRKQKRTIQDIVVSDYAQEINKIIIDVYELPTENIDENAIYRLVEQPAELLRVDVDGKVDRVPLPLYEGFGASLNIYRVQNRPTENIQFTYNYNIHLYYVDSENDFLICVQTEEDDDPISYTWFSDFDELDVDIKAISCHEVNNSLNPDTIYVVLSEVTYHKYYNGEWINSLTPIGDITLTQNGTHNILKQATATVNVPTIYVVQKLEDLPEDAPNGSVAYVLGGGT